MATLPTEMNANLRPDMIRRYNKDYLRCGKINTNGNAKCEYGDV
jgi:hypothetical protein